MHTQYKTLADHIYCIGILWNWTAIGTENEEVYQH